MSIINTAVEVAEEAFRAEVRIELTPGADQVVRKMMACTLEDTMSNLQDPEEWWHMYEAYAVKHAQIIARVASSLASAGKRPKLEAEDLVDACDIVVERARRVCPQSLGNKTGCGGYSRDAIRIT